MSIRPCVIFFLLSLTHVSVEAGPKVRIATLNCNFLARQTVHVKYGLNLEKKLWTPEETATWTEAYRNERFRESVASIAVAVKRINADVIVLCEIGEGPDAAALLEEVNRPAPLYPFAIVADSSDTATAQSVAVFSKVELTNGQGQIPGRESYETELDDLDEESDTALSKGLVTDFQVGSQLVHLYATHLKSERGGHESDAQRIAQASIVRRNYLAQLRRGEHVIVAGDLNDHPGQPAIRRIMGRDDIDDDLLFTGHAKFFDQSKLDDRWSFSYLGRRELIAYVLISKSLREQTLRGGSILAETLPVTEKLGDSDILATDHRSFILTLELAEE